MDHFLDDYGNKSVSNKEWVYSYKTKLHENDLITDPEGYDYLGLHERLKWWDADHPAQQYLKGYGSDVERFYELDTEMNKMNPKKSIISFAVREAMLMDENDTTLEPSSILQLFETGTMADKDRLQEIWQADKFEIPSIPGTPLLDSSKPNAITHDTINLRCRPVRHGVSRVKEDGRIAARPAS
jgi:hypothetical protein